CRYCGRPLPRWARPVALPARRQYQVAEALPPRVPVSPPAKVQPVIERGSDESMFCIQCGTGLAADATQCNQCGAPVTMPPPATVRKLLDAARSESDDDKRLVAIRALGIFKVRRALPLLFEIDHNRGGEVQLQARMALARIVDFSVSMLPCKCGAFNPATAHFCYVCGTPVARPTASPQEFADLLRQVEQSEKKFPLDAVQKLGYLQSSAAVPVLLDLYKRFRKGWRDNLETLVILEALIDIGDPAAVDVASKLARIYYQNFLPVTVNCHYALVRLGEQEKAWQSLRLWSSPNREDKTGYNLRYVIQLGELGKAEDVAALTRCIMEEKKRWDVGIGYNVWLFDPVTFLVTAAASVAYNVIGRAILNSQGRNAASWMVSPLTLDPSEFEKLTGQLRKMIALHCYGTALVSLGQRHRKTLQEEFCKCKKPLERAVLGLALGELGYATVADTLRTLSEDSDWSTRILAYEGLVALVAHSETVKSSECLRALKDSDQRVRVAVAKVLADTQNPVYVPALVKLLNTQDNKQLEAYRPVVAQLARNGVPEAQVKLQQLGA
ncbi:MAG: hypothetical protein JXA33_12875, partial [Anaerolineae bacterium]|nr:hypothetical protein [Anaerolineae bacterium]